MNRWLRRAGIGAAAVVGLLVVGVAAVYGASEVRLRRSYAAVPAPALRVDSVSLARGAHLVRAIGKCADCHGEDLGGQVFIEVPGLGRVVASNLTSGKGGVLGRYDDARLARAIRGGVRHDGRPLRIMPSEDWQAMSDQDAADLIAYLRSLPPVDRVPDETTIGPLGRLLMLTGQLPLLPAERIPAQRPTTEVPRGVTREYGAYLADVGGCTGCHRPDLAGGHVPGTPPDYKDPANLTPAGPLGRWSEQDFMTALRQGRRPDGSRLDDFMPWRATARMTDDEIRALWLYLRSVPPVTRES